MRSFQRWAFRLGTSALTAGAISGGCARPMAPSGGPVDFIPPMVASTWPDTFQVIEPTRDPVKIIFSERISERPTEGSLNAAVIVSPVTAEHRVKHTRSGLEVEVIGGFKPDLVYRVRVLPTIKDLFSNEMQGPFELVFSTGAPFETNVVAGIVKDRVSGEAIQGVLVQAREEGAPEPPVYVAASDSSGVFALRYLPAGAYRLSLFQDVNRNSEPDFSELQGSAETPAVGTLAEAADTVILREIGLLRPDTLPARVVLVEAMDSLLVRVGFDDYMDAEGSLEEVGAVILAEDSTEVRIDRLLWPRQVDSLRAVADSIAAEERRLARVDSLQVLADSLGQILATMRAAGDTVGVDTLGPVLEQIQTRLEPPEPPEEEPEGPREPVEPPPILPQREFFIRLVDSLAPNRPYHLTVTGIVNINGLPGGGGEASFDWEPPEREADTAGVAADTASTPPDTGAVTSPDTWRLPPERSRPPPGAPPPNRDAWTSPAAPSPRLSPVPVRSGHRPNPPWARRRGVS